MQGCGHRTEVTNKLSVKAGKPQELLYLFPAVQSWPIGHSTDLYSPEME